MEKDKMGFDFFGQELKVGDKVAYQLVGKGSFRAFEVCEIQRISNKSVHFQPPDHNYSFHRPFSKIFKEPKRSN